MATVYDVAAYILASKGAMTAMKLQKLVYYAQAWALVWDEAPLFEEHIEAWANGPVVPDLYEVHKGQFKLQAIPGGDPSKLSDNQRDSIDKMLEFYGDQSSQWLSNLTHTEDPWLDARKGVPMGQRSNQEITHAALMEYYSSL